MLLALGEDLAYVMEQVGHVDARMTTGIYIKVMRRGEDEKAALRALVDGAEVDRFGPWTATTPSEGAQNPP